MFEAPKEIASDYFLLKIKHHGEIPQAGQFINLKVNSTLDPLLRRPFSIFNYSHKKIEIIIKKKGKGTSLLTKKAAEPLDFLGPLGEPFTLVEKKEVLLIGGGVGNAPLFFLSQALKKLKNKITFLYGIKTSSEIFLTEKFKKQADNLIFVTEDGSKGEKGLVTDYLPEICSKENFAKIYTCGPTKMMQRIVELSSLPVEVSLENYFGCGIGLCSGCTVETSSGLKRACVEGPVFSGKEINWAKL